jgi:demethylmenaquinone methyltransferase/2-methoxy-6-polyprenyl-1,4-benzoquinol methylase
VRHDKIKPYDTDREKKEEVAQMFNNIANRYDLLNSVLSLGIHKGWRKKCVQLLRSSNPKTILDVATGTGDFAIACMRLDPEKITGIDISEGMLQVGREKIHKLNLTGTITLQNGNAETVAFADSSFDAIVVGFGVRNFQDLQKGLANMYRILKPGGKLVILEFSYPSNTFIKGAYNFYFSYITPFVGKLLSKDTRAYSYLTESVKAFPNNEKFVALLDQLNFKDTGYKPLSLGIAAIYTGGK